MARSRPPSFDFFPEDFISGTMHLHPFCIGMYIRLLCFQWSHEHIPTDTRALLQVTGATSNEELNEHLEAVLEKFPVYPDGKRRNPRLEAERLKKLGISQVRADAARESWRVRRDANASASADANACANLDANGDAKNMQREVGSRKKEEGSRKPEEGSRKKEAGGGAGEPSAPKYSRDFEAFWDAYPRVRRVNKAQAWKAWSKAIKLLPPADLIEAAREYSESPLGSGEFSCQPATFLNSQKWEDDRASWQRSSEKKTFAQQRDENTDAAGERFEARWAAQVLPGGEI
jgi:uncharacterized protein YdaU (DUF1376 family)